MPKGKSKARIENPDVHVAIREPEEVRRLLLESAKDSIKLLQRHERLEDIRNQKKALFEEVRVLLKEMVFLNNKLDRVMPRVKVNKPSIDKELRQEVEKLEETEESSAEVSRSRPVARSRLDELEDELADIESRIKSLR